jgi:hypothetical protein
MKGKPAREPAGSLSLKRSQREPQGQASGSQPRETGLLLLPEIAFRLMMAANLPFTGSMEVLP